MKGVKKSFSNSKEEPALKKRAQVAIARPEPEEEEEALEDPAGQDDFQPELDDFEEAENFGAEEDPEAEEGFEDGEPPEDAGEDEPLELERNILEADRGLLSMKIQELLQQLADFKGQGANSESRVSLLIELRKLFCKYFSYNLELMEYIMGLFSPAECYAFLEMMDTPRPVTIRINSLRTPRAALVKALTEKSVALEPVEEVSKMAFKVNASKVPVGATPEYLAGHYMLQSAASMLAVRALAPQPGERVLDMAAAPGGKTTYIGQLMKNQGTIVANDLKTERTKALFFNCQRMGLTNVIVTNYDGRRIPGCLKGFDRVLLDAPCTGLGVISRDPSIKAKRGLMDIYKAAHLQRELLRKAIDYCKVGGYVVYSTCSFAVEENEAVVDYACRRRFVKIVDTGIELESKAVTKFKDSHFNDRMKYCIRVLPHVHNIDGFFVAKLLKLKDGERKREEEETTAGPKKAKIVREKAGPVAESRPSNGHANPAKEGKARGKTASAPQDGLSRERKVKGEAPVEVQGKVGAKRPKVSEAIPPKTEQAPPREPKANPSSKPLKRKKTE